MASNTRLRSGLVLLSFLTLLVVASSARAQTQMVIKYTEEDTAQNQVVIHGEGFGAGVRVFLGLVELPVTSLSATQVRATLGASIAPGSHWLILYQPAGPLFAQFWSTFGQVGPAGPAGATGATGPLQLHLSRFMRRVWERRHFDDGQQPSVLDCKRRHADRHVLC